LPGGEVSDLKHKNHPFNPTITYDQGLSPKDLAIAKKKVGAAIELINSKWSELSEFQQNVLSLMKTIDVFGGSRGGIDPKTFDFALSFGDNVSSSSTARIASDIAHDSYHLYQQFTMGPPTREGALSRESSATRFEIGVGRTLGLTRDEIRFLNDAAAHPENYWRFEVH
jgi:hypothetical protein